MPITQRAPKSRHTPGQTVLPGLSALEPNKKKRAEPEFEEQCELFHFLRANKGRHPVLGWVHASLNGLPLTPAVMRKAQASGMTAGIYDVFVPAVRTWADPTDPADQPRTRPGLYLEMKAGKNGLTDDQKRYREHCEREGYALAVAYNWIDAASIIVRYLGIEDREIDVRLSVNRKATVKYSTPDPLAGVLPRP